MDLRLKTAFFRKIRLTPAVNENHMLNQIYTESQKLLLAPFTTFQAI